MDEGLTHWGRVTHICVGKITIIGSDNGLSPGRRQAIIWTNVGILLIRPLGTNFSEILIGIQTFSFKKMSLKMSSAKWRPFCLGLNVLNHHRRLFGTDPVGIIVWGLNIALIRFDHCNDVIMSTMASQIASLTIVYSIVYLSADQRKHQSSALLAFVRGVRGSHRRPVNSSHKEPITRKMFLFDDVIMKVVSRIGWSTADKLRPFDKIRVMGVFNASMQWPLSDL